MTLLTSLYPFGNWAQSSGQVYLKKPVFRRPFKPPAHRHLHIPVAAGTNHLLSLGAASAENASHKVSVAALRHAADAQAASLLQPATHHVGMYQQSLATAGSGTWYPPATCPAGSAIGVKMWGGGNNVTPVLGTYTVDPNDVASGVPYVIGSGATGSASSWSQNNLNVLPNSIMADVSLGVAPSPGAWPTGWLYYAVDPGMSLTLIGTGFESGLPYTDFMLSGTSTESSYFQLFFCGPQVIAATNGQQWSESFYMTISAGATTGFTVFAVQINENNSAGAGINSSEGYFTPVSGALASNRQSVTWTLPDATAAYVVPTFTVFWSSGTVLSITLRIGAPQMELAAAASAWKSTPGYISAAGSGASGAAGQALLTLGGGMTLLGSAEVAALATTKIPGGGTNYPKAVGGASADVAAMVKLVAAIRAAADAQAAATARVVSYFRSFAGASAETTRLVRSVALARGAIDAEAVAHTLLVSMARGAADGQAATRQLLVSIARAAADAEAATRTLLVSIARGATDGETSALARTAAYLRATAATSSGVAGRTLLIAIIRGAASAEATAFQRVLSAFRTLATTDAQAAAAQRSAAIKRGAADANVAAITTQEIGYTNPLSLAATTTQAAARRVLVGVIRSAANAQASAYQRLVATFRSLSATDAQAAATQRAVAVIRSATDAETAAVVPNPLGYTNPLSVSATSSQAAAVRRLTAIIRGAAETQVAAYQRSLASFRTLATVETEVAFVQRLISVTRSTSGSETAFVIRLVSTVRSATVANIAAVKRLAAYYRMLAAVSAQVSFVLRLVAIVRRAASTEAAAITRTLAYYRVLGAVSAEVAAIAAAKGWSKVLSAAQANVAALVATYQHSGINYQIYPAAISAEVAALQRSVAKILAAASAEISALTHKLAALRALNLSTTESTALARNTAKFFASATPNAGITSRLVSIARSTLDAEAAALTAIKARLVLASAATLAVAHLASRAMHALSEPASGTSAANLVKLVSATRGLTSTEAVAHLLVVAKRLTGAASAQAAAIVALSTHTYFQAVSAVSAQAAALRRLTAHTLSGVSANASSVLRAIAALRGYAGAGSQALVRLIAHQAGAAGAQSATRIAARGHVIASGAASAQVAAVALVHGIGLLYHVAVAALSAGATALSLGRYRLIPVACPASQNTVHWYHWFVPGPLRRRIVRLPLGRLYSKLPSVVRRVRLPPARLSSKLPPAVRRIVLPREEDELSDYEIYRPEPADFSPLDPTDTDVFTFDWSVRGYAGDTIIHATVVSIPAGVNFVGPPFIDAGPLVEVMVGPFAIVPSLPATYLLRCTAVFASGRVSNFSIPVMIKTL